MSLKEVKRTAAVAWSPAQQAPPLLATGTLAGALDASFSTKADLEIHELNLDDKSSVEVVQKTSFSAATRASKDPQQVIIHSMLIYKIFSEKALLARCEAHRGAVRGLQVNPFQPYLVASGATDAEPYSPSSTKSNKLEDITDLAWNRIVPHILATASNSGTTVVWDLKSRKEVLQLTAPGQRVGMSAIAWNPENATQIAIASDDDQTPVIYSWDLRNARAPEKGILSLAWCPKDAELLLSCGKDNKSICWNPKAGTVVAELTHSDNWLFDIQWCPRNPDLFSTASFSGTVEVNSFQGLMSGGGRPAGPSGTAEDFFTQASMGTAQRTVAATHVQIPKWLRRPIGVTFGFGGRLITFSSLRSETGRIVTISNVAMPAAEELTTASMKLDAALSTQNLVEFCAKKTEPIPNLHIKDSEAVFWNVAKVMFESNPQEKLMNLLGFDRQQLEDKIRTLTIAEEAAHKTTTQTSVIERAKSNSSFSNPPANVEPHKFDDFFGGAGGEQEDSFDFGSLVEQPEEQEKVASVEETGESTSSSGHERHGTYQGVPFSLFASESSEIDRTITRAIILGNFEAAVNLCVKADRLSDALLVAICGGDELVARTQQIYFQKARFPYLRVVSGIVKKDISDVVEHASIENWEEILALICSYAKGPTFMHLCNVLGSRIEAAMPSNPTFATPALICYMAAGNATKAVTLVITQQKRSAPSQQYFLEYAMWLESVVEKTRILEQVSGYVDPQNVQPVQDTVPEVSDQFIEYAYVMASNGLLDVAVRYYNSFSNSRQLNGADDLVTVFGDRLSKATRSLGIPIRPVPEPFELVAVDVLPDGVNSANLQSQEPSNIQGPPHGQSFAHHSQQPQSQWAAPAQSRSSQSAIPPMPQPFATSTSNAFNRVPMVSTPPVPMAPSSFAAAPPLPQAPSSFVSAPPPIVPMPTTHSFTGSLSPTQAPPMPTSASHLYSSPAIPPAPMAPISPHGAPPVGFGAPSMPTPSAYATAPYQTSPPIVASSPVPPSIPAPVRPMMPQPPRLSATPPPAAASLRAIGAYNDPPMVAPRVPVGHPMVQQQISPAAPPPVAVTSQPAPVSASVQSTPARQQKASPGPVDPSKIPQNVQPIYRTFSTLISQCQERALPMQRRVVEDSARRMQALFHQLENQELSDPVIQIVNDMCSYINSGQFDKAHELHTALMTSYFAEAGAWVLAAKRLIEVAKICLH